MKSHRSPRILDLRSSLEEKIKRRWCLRLLENLSKRITVRRALLSSSWCKQHFLGIVRCDAASRLGDSNWRTCRSLGLPRLALPQCLCLFRYGKFDPRKLGIDTIGPSMEANSDGDTSNSCLSCLATLCSFCIHRHVLGPCRFHFTATLIPNILWIIYH